jgi:chemotaxis protein methyltransferase CheR
MVSDADVEELIHDLLVHYGYDFGGYSRASFKRRIERLFQMDGFTHFRQFHDRVQHDPDYFTRLVEEVTVNVTEMFRDPHFYKALRDGILPILGTKPFIRIWHAGCATGEEVYSMAVMLKETGLLHKSILYATDINGAVLESAKRGVFPLRLMKQYAENYRESGGNRDFSEYYTANYGFAKFSEELSQKMVFAQHSLVSDHSFNEFDLILCRNVLIYFEKELQDRAIRLFDDSLARLGYLALGTKETLKYTSVYPKYQQWQKEKLWKKIK